MTPTLLSGRYLDFPFSAWCESDRDVDRTVASIRAYAAAHPGRPLQIVVGVDQKQGSSAASVLRSVLFLHEEVAGRASKGAR
jgi:hypothetical protein